MAELRVLVQTVDALAGVGLTSLLSSNPGLVVLPAGSLDGVDVIVMEADRFTAEAVATLRFLAAKVGRPVVLVISDIDEPQLITAVECGVVAILPRGLMSRDRLVQNVLAAASGGRMMPPHLIGRLLEHFRRMQLEVLQPNGFGPRRPDLMAKLRLLAVFACALLIGATMAQFPAFGAPSPGPERFWGGGRAEGRPA